MNVLITLIAAGTDTGPFNLYSNVDNYTTAFQTGVTKSSLITGLMVTTVPNTASIIRVASTGTCTNSIDLSIAGVPPATTTSTTTPYTGPTTTTSTSTSTTSTSTTSTSSTSTTSTTSTTTTVSPAHPYSFRLSTGYSTGTLACADGVQAITVYGDNGSFLANDFFYVASTGSTKYSGFGLYYNNVDTYVYAQISNLGTITDSGICP